MAVELEGLADLPLHEGSVPPWLARIMKRLAKAILEVMVEEFGPNRVVERFSNPLWFQGFNNVIGMDWDSSGSTTVTTGILKTVTWSDPHLGLLGLGGKGRSARKVPEEAPRALELLGVRGLSPNELIKASRLIAKIDNAMVQDGYTLYHHALFVSEDGRWAVVQQGMNTRSRMARRYHWLCTTGFYENPHEAVSGVKHEHVLNLVDRGSRDTQRVVLDLARSNPSSVVEEYARAYNAVEKQKSLDYYVAPTRTGLVGVDYSGKALIYKPLPTPSSLLKKLRRIREVYPHNLDELLLVRGVDADVLRALALISDLVFNEPPSTRDPVDTPYDPFIYAYAIGGKDGVPYPVNRRVAEEVIYTLEDFIERAKLGDKEKLRALKSLSRIKFRVLGKYLG